MTFDLPARLKAAGVHLLISSAVAALAAGLVFLLWYPGIYRLMSGGRELFLLVTSVDVVLGPMLTFAVFNLKKGWPHLRRDLAVIAAIQLVALAYGLNTVYEARPVAMVFEVDRFRVVTAVDVYRLDLPEALPKYRTLPLNGPWLLVAELPEAVEERNKALFMAVGGVDIGQRPKYWRPFDEGRAVALARARPIEALMKKYPERAPEIQATLTEARLTTASARFLPISARGDWIAVLDPSGEVTTFLQADGFF